MHNKSIVDMHMLRVCMHVCVCGAIMVYADMACASTNTRDQSTTDAGHYRAEAEASNDIRC
jgi:hypothetical protein